MAAPHLSIEDMITVSKAAEIAGVSTRRIRQLIESGDLKAIPINPRMWMLHRRAVVSWAKKPQKLGRPRRSQKNLEN